MNKLNDDSIRKLTHKNKMLNELVTSGRIKKVNSGWDELLGRISAYIPEFLIQKFKEQG